MPAGAERPPLLLFLSLDPRALPWVALCTAAGTTRVGHDAPTVPRGTLCLHWPAHFPWTAALLETAGAVRDRGGVVLPLPAVLKRLGRVPRDAAGLFALFDLDAEGGEPPEVMGRLAEALAARLAEAEDASPGGPEPRYAIRPEILIALGELPARPGVYVFSAADGRALYVGKARSLAQRVGRHFGPRPAEPGKSEALARDAVRLAWTETGSDLEALLREQLAIWGERPALNTQERVHARPRGAWRRAAAFCVLPSADTRSVEVCLVRGEGAFHWERVPRGPRVPQGLWRRLQGALRGEAGWGPGRPEVPLSPEGARALAEITLGWLVRHGDAVTRIDLRHETGGRALHARLRRLLVEDPRTGRVECP